MLRANIRRFILLLSLTHCTLASVQMISMRTPEHYLVLGPEVEGNHCGGWLTRMESFPHGSKYHTGAPILDADFGLALQNALNQTSPQPADGLIHAEFWKKRSWKHFGRYCVYVKGVPVRLSD